MATATAAAVLEELAVRASSPMWKMLFATRSIFKEREARREKGRRSATVEGKGEEEDEANGGGSVEAGDIKSLLTGEGRDYLVRNNGDMVSIDSLQGGKFGLYFSASWCPPCRRFTPKLVEAYRQLPTEGRDFEVIFVSGDRDEDSFNGYFARMPWLAIPFSDSGARKRLNSLYKVSGIPHLVITDAHGKVLNEDGVEIVRDYGVDGYPFTSEKQAELREAEEAAKREQTLRSVLVSPSRDFVILNDGTQVPVSDLEGKIVALYFADSRFPPSAEFTPILAQIYEKLKEKGEKFEVVLVSLDDDESSFVENFSEMPWFALPFEGNSRERLARYFELCKLPFVAIIGADGKTMDVNFAEIVEEHGVEALEAFPFHQENLDSLAAKAKAKLEAQTLESLLVSGDLDFVIGKEDTKVPVKDLVGKNIILYFSAQWCGPCRAFLPKLVEIYHNIKSKDDAFEIIFISSDRDQSSFDEFYSGMPWLALPLGDARKKQLSRTFKIRGIPSLVAIGPSGRTLTTNARQHLMIHGADAYPFTEDRLAELERQIEEMAKGWPEKIKHELHEQHELLLVRCATYGCDACQEMGTSWSYRCKECDFDLHPKCALKESKEKSEELVEDHEETSKDGCVCDGDVCRKV